MNNKTLTGKVVAGDSDLKTITIQCDGSINGLKIGSNATIVLNFNYNNQILDDEDIPKPPKAKTEEEMIRQLKDVTKDEDRYFPGYLGNPLLFCGTKKIINKRIKESK